MPDAATARIGPNAVTQMVPALDRVLGADVRTELLAQAGIIELPRLDAGLMPEAPAARLHQVLRAKRPEEAPEIARAAGLATGDYILANRIPKPAQTLLKLLPARLAAPLLISAIAKHAWTFAGSGRFEVFSRDPITFAIHDNPVVRGETALAPVCHWHAAVFERLFTTLVHPAYTVRETACGACGAPACVFELTR